MRFTIKESDACIARTEKDLDYITDLFTEQWRAARECKLAALNLAIGQTIKVCGIQITRTE
ncbi:MAG: hypothetical protein RL662_2370 [Bacteroidota bacterium]|jgi:hypothetical protein